MDTGSTHETAAGSATPLSFPEPPPPKRWTRRFIAVYAILGLILAVSLGAVLATTLRPGLDSKQQWSSWKPQPDRLPVMAKEIADHVGPTYQFAKGGQLVAVVPSPPAVTVGPQNVSIVAVASPVKVGDKQSTKQQNVARLEPGEAEMYTLCGLGTQCSIASGKPSIARGRLIRRQGLEVALYTFKYIPAVDSVLMYMPPGPTATSQDVLYFTREGLSGSPERPGPLDKPLSETLAPATPTTPHRPGQADAAERDLIDRLTLPNLYASGIILLPSSGALLTLAPRPV